MFDLLEIVTSPAIDAVKIIDVGAMSIGTDDLFTPLVRSGRGRIVGFEPLPHECERLNRLHGPPHLFLPYVIGDGSPGTFRVCNTGVTSSMYEPNTPLLSLFQNLENVTRVVAHQPVQTRRLDDVEQAQRADYLKLDVQGAELNVLRGASQLLKSVLVVQTEVEFVPMYQGQPLFAEIDQALRSAGFLFHRMHATAGRTFVPIVMDNDVNRMGSQTLWGVALYVRDFMRLDLLSVEQLSKLALILHAAFGSYDMVHFVLRAIDARLNTTFASAYMSKLSSGPVELRW